MNNIYLELEIRKSNGKTDAFGNYIFEVEASNENLDLQNQIVLQNALMNSKDEFLKGGVISFDHLHKRKDENGNVISDPSMVIGEPIDVKFDTANKSTIVVGKLYSTNEKARELINMLKAGSTRVRASVGGIFPQVIKNAKTGIEKITSVLWNDLALTTSPVNNTVGSAVFAKSLTSYEFVNALPIELKKSLCAGYETNSSEITGGACLIPEDTSTNTIDLTNKNKINTQAQFDNAIRDVANLLKNGQIAGEENAIEYLLSQGVEMDLAREIIREMILQGGQFMKKSFSSAVSNLYKSLVGANHAEEDDDELNKSEEELDETEELDFDDDEEIDEETSDDEDDEDDEINKSNEDFSDDDNSESEDEDDNSDDDEEESEEDENLVSGNEVLKSLDFELKTMRKSMKSQNAQIKDLGKAVSTLAKMVYAIGNEQLPPKSTLAKSVNANTKANKNRGMSKGRPSEDDLYRVQCVLQRCVKDGIIDMQKSSMISSDMQKCMYTGKPMKTEYYEFLKEQLNKGV